ncbi:MAG: hypothetical protein PHE25_06435 [Candidatus Gracilibacteria bacterium]|nr:hypothetical protein [Candidatus Gracilibacteria bacterium]
MLKINLDNIFNKQDLFKTIILNKSEVLFFYNSQKGDNLNRILIFEIIFFIIKSKLYINYYFYNIPFCFFKRFGRDFIDKHCVRNRLCNYYYGYITHNKCNKCIYGLFCNNFNHKINNTQFYGLEGFYEEIINKEYLLNILLNYKKLILSLGYSDNEVCFYTTQKYIVEFLDGDIKYIGKSFLSYLTIYFLLDNDKLSKMLFESLDSFTLVLKEKDIELELNSLVRKYGININFSLGKGNNIKYYSYMEETLKLEYYYSRLKYNGKRDFFDFTTGFYINKDVNEFQGIVYNKKRLILEIDVNLIKKASDIIGYKSDVYMGRDIISGLNLNNFKGIIISSDGLGDAGRLVQSFNSIKVPIIYNIQPDFTLYLKDTNRIKINFETGVIQKV